MSDKKERTKEEIIADVLGWESFSPGPVMADTDDFLKAMEEYRQSSPVESKWVSVKERTPEFDGRYLCFIEAPQECGNIWRFQETVDLHFNEWITSEDQTVTHWKPLDPNP